MGVFDDKKFEQLDWMTQITETIDSDLNGLLARLPDRLTFDMGSLLLYIEDSYSMSLSTDSVVRRLLRTAKHQMEVETNKKIKITWEEERKIFGCFEFEVEEGTEVDFENKTMIGSFTLVKNTPTLDDTDLQSLMGREGLDDLRNTRATNPVRMNEVMELLGGIKPDYFKSRSVMAKKRAIHQRLEVIFKTNEWRIRDMELANKVCKWLCNYMISGDLASMANFCKLKVMTHNNMPIYSVEETV